MTVQFGWDAFVYTFTLSTDWTDGHTNYVQEASPTMRDYLKDYVALGVDHHIRRFTLAKTDLPHIFETAKFLQPDVDAKLAQLTRLRQWHYFMAAPHYGYGGALGLTIFFSCRPSTDLLQAEKTVIHLRQWQAQMNAWARIALEKHTCEEKLTPREMECLLLVTEGKTSIEIANVLSIAKRTVEFHIQNAVHKLGGLSRSQAASRLTQRSMTPSDCYGAYQPVIVDPSKRS